MVLNNNAYTIYVNTIKPKPRHQMNTINYVNTLKSKPRHQMNTNNYVNTIKHKPEENQMFVLEDL